MNQNLAGKRVIVTGGSRGIGYAIADKLSHAGAVVAICGRNERDLREAVTALGGSRSGKVVGTIADVSSSESVAGLFRWTDEQLGGLDLLVNNAGIGIFKPAAELTPEEWRKVIDVNLNGAFYCTREALQRFRLAGGGYLINISSLAGKNPFAGGAAYNASKFGLNGFSEAVMLDHRADGVRVTYIMPGSVDTEFGGSAAGADWKIHPRDLAQIVMDLLALPERTLVSRVEVRPSRPPRK
ncbi:MAG: SDR family oxidoreductase [Bryobacteraceae bacterium]|nr:SDR family oxidoreductase [Bryobacteraceae bacterium]